jgi:hypothetical protein
LLISGIGFICGAGAKINQSSALMFFTICYIKYIK